MERVSVSPSIAYPEVPRKDILTVVPFRIPLSILSLPTHLNGHSTIRVPFASTFPALINKVIQHPTLVIHVRVLRYERF